MVTLERSDSVKYYPRFVVVSKPRGHVTHEFLVRSVDQIGTLAKISSIFSKHNANILMAYGYFDSNSNSAVDIFFCDLPKADSIAAQIEKEISGLSFVTETRVCNMVDRLFEQYLFPNLIYQKHRALILRADSLTGLEKRMVEKLGSPGGALMFEEGRAFALNSAEELAKDEKEFDSKRSIASLVDALRAMGWGLFEFNEHEDRFEVDVKSPPIITLPNLLESRFLYGIIAGAVEAYTGHLTRINNSVYDRKSDTLHVTLKKEH